MKFIDIEKVIIPKDFLRKCPSSIKTENAKSYIKEHGVPDRELVVDDNFVLVDNYTRYIAAKEMGIKNIQYVFVQDCPEYNNYITGRFNSNRKLYFWKNPKNIKLKKGDKVLVEVNNNKNNKTIVTVKNIFWSKDIRYLQHKNIIAKLD